jgi:hypothetical protein
MELHSTEPATARLVKAHFEKKLEVCQRTGTDDERAQVRVVDKQTQASLVQKQVSFDVDVAQGFADMKITQVYQNDTTSPMEIVFKMPISDTFSINTIQARFLLQDGTETSLETRVVERQKAIAKYEDTVASG